MEDNAQFMINGKVICDVKPVEVECKPATRELKNESKLFTYSREYSATLKDVRFDQDRVHKFSEDIKFTLTGQRYDFPRGNKLPKKKRIRKKWKKKYLKEFTLDNCTIG